MVDVFTDPVSLFQPYRSKSRAPLQAMMLLKAKALELTLRTFQNTPASTRRGSHGRRAALSQ